MGYGLPAASLTDSARLPRILAGWATPSQTRVGLPHLLFMSAVAACLSIGLQGFYFGVTNNVYHIAIVEGWLDDPQFSSDQFIQSLHYMTSYVWPVARQIAGWLGTYWTFLLLHGLNRVAMFIGIALLLKEMGVYSTAGLGVALLTLAVTPYLHSASSPGAHDLFMAFFNHSSVTWPFLFASYLLLMRGRIVVAVGLQGIVFGINAFVAICGGPALAVGSIAIWPEGRQARNTFLLQWAAGLALALLLAAPMVIWIARSFIEQQAAPAFSFLQFLRDYFHDHWFISATPVRRLISFVLIALSGILSLSVLRARVLAGIWIWHLVVFVIGMALPLIVDSRVILDLHPMRVGAGCLVMLSVIAILALLGRTLEAAPTNLARFAAGVGLLGLAYGQEGMIVMAAGVLAITVIETKATGRFSSPAGSMILSRSGALVTVAVALLLVAIFHVARAPAPYDLDELAAGRGAGAWLQANTPPGSMFLVPSAGRYGRDDPVQTWARRPVWYNWKEGAAVMWTPSYFVEWATRRHELADLHGFSDTVAYACKHDIAYLVVTPSELERSEVASRPGLVFANAGFTILRTAALCGHA